LAKKRGDLNLFDSDRRTGTLQGCDVSWRSWTPIITMVVAQLLRTIPLFLDANADKSHTPRTMVEESVTVLEPCGMNSLRRHLCSSLEIQSSFIGFNHQPPAGVGYGFVKVKATSPPVVAPPTQVPDMLPVGHTALAARTHCSHRSLEMLICAPASAVLRANRAVPDLPVVSAGRPWHLVTGPAMPRQIDNSATFWS